MKNIIECGKLLVISHLQNREFITFASKDYHFKK